MSPLEASVVLTANIISRRLGGTTAVKEVKWALPLTCVWAQVTFECSMAGESPVAFAANVAADAGVDLHVLLQCRLGLETLPTKQAKDGHVRPCRAKDTTEELELWRFHFFYKWPPFVSCYLARLEHAVYNLTDVDKNDGLIYKKTLWSHLSLQHLTVDNQCHLSSNKSHQRLSMHND